MTSSRRRSIVQVNKFLPSRLSSQFRLHGYSRSGVCVRLRCSKRSNFLDFALGLIQSFSGNINALAWAVVTTKNTKNVKRGTGWSFLNSGYKVTTHTQKPNGSKPKTKTLTNTPNMLDACPWQRRFDAFSFGFGLLLLNVFIVQCLCWGHTLIFGVSMSWSV